MNRWVQSDPYAAGSWLGTLPASDSRDAAVTIYTQRIVSTDPPAALQWAQTIGNENKRNSQLESLAGTWLKTDPSRAASWIANSSLPDDIKKQLLPPSH